MKLDKKTIDGIEPGYTGKLTDGRGLHLLVSKTGSKLWRLNYRFGGKQKTLALGAYPEVSLDRARDKCIAARRQLEDGIDPSAARKAEKQARRDTASDSFGQVTADWLEKSKPGWTESTYAQTKSRLDNDVLPYLKDRPVTELAAPELLTVAQRVVDRGAIETARRITRIMKQIMQHAVITGKAPHNPAIGLVEALPTVKTQHMAAITAPEAAGELLRAIDGYAGEPATRAALQLAPMVFVRPGELRQALWSEIDLENGVWEIPAARTKMREPLIVPLATQAVEIFRELYLLTGEGELVFPSNRSRFRPISDNTMNAALRRMGYRKDEMTAHGFRAMARTMLDEIEELSFRYDVIEQQLGHVVRDPNGRAYNRTKHLPERTKMMQTWADYLDRLRGGTVQVGIES